jgi:hypothetical protein
MFPAETESRTPQEIASELDIVLADPSLVAASRSVLNELSYVAPSPKARAGKKANGYSLLDHIEGVREQMWANGKSSDEITTAIYGILKKAKQDKSCK